MPLLIVLQNLGMWFWGTLYIEVLIFMSCSFFLPSIDKNDILAYFKGTTFDCYFALLPIINLGWIIDYVESCQKSLALIDRIIFPLSFVICVFDNLILTNTRQEVNELVHLIFYIIVSTWRICFSDISTAEFWKISSPETLWGGYAFSF